MQQLKSGFKRTINWNKYHLKMKLLKAPNPHLNILNNQSFQGVNIVFALPFNASDSRKGHSRDYLPSTIVEDYNVMIDG